jgi:exosome complex component MTR3
VQAEEDKEAAIVMQNSLEAAVQLDAFPKSVVSVHCVVMESGGSDLAVLITAASLALADAGIPMFDLVSACSIVSTLPS